MIVVLMGVSGRGKTAVGQALAADLGWPGEAKVSAAIRRRPIGVLRRDPAGRRETP